MTAIRALTALLALCLLAMPSVARAVEYDEFGFIIGNEPIDPTLPVNEFAPMEEPKYALRVDLGAQRTTAYEKDEKGQYTVPVRVMKCSTGLPETPTPTGYFKSSPVGDWYYFKEFEVWAQYVTRIEGGIMFHSVLYSEQNEKTLISGSVKKLGSKASHGCIRLALEDAKWLYDNAGNGSIVHVLDKDPYRPSGSKSSSSSSSSSKSSSDKTAEKSAAETKASESKSSSEAKTTESKSSSETKSSSASSSASSSSVTKKAVSTPTSSRTRR